MKILTNLAYYIPELIIVVTMMGLLLIEAAYGRWEKGRTYVFVSSALGLILALIVLLMNMNNPATAIFTNSLMIDPFSSFMKMSIILGGLGSIFLSKDSKDIYHQFKSEYVVLVVGVIFGGMLLASANNLLTLYLGIEILSILSYVLASLKKYNSKSSEAGLKYVLYGGLSAGIMLFGMSYVYGVLGTIHFAEIAEKIKTVSGTDLFILAPALLCFFVGIGYKIACAPFHMWAPDVYEGSPFPVTTFFAIVPKLAGVAALVRVSYVFFSHPGALQIGWVGVLQVAAVLTMTIGNVTAIGQKSVKRMLAYSSISHAGFMMLGVVVMNEIGVQSLLFYGFTYLFMTLVAFYVVSFVADQYGNDHFERFHGLIRRYPVMSIALCFAMFSLAGLPPFSGFVAKFHVISAAVSKGFIVLALIAVLNSVVSLYYYLRLVRLMIFKDVESEEKIEGFSFLNQVVITGLAIPVLVLGIFWDQVMFLAQQAKIFIK